MRILPEMCASTLCPLSSSTRNCVLGSASVMVPSTSMTSSLAKDLLFSDSYKLVGAKRIYYHVGPPTPSAKPLPLPGRPAVRGEHPRAVLGDGYGVLKVSREGAVGGVDGPVVILVEDDAVVAQRDHGLYGEGHPSEQAGSRVGTAVVGNLGVLVHLASDPVGDEVPHHPVAARLGQRLYRVTHVAEPVAGPHLLCGRGEALPRGL